MVSVSGEQVEAGQDENCHRLNAPTHAARSGEEYPTAHHPQSVVELLR